MFRSIAGHVATALLLLTGAAASAFADATAGGGLLFAPAPSVAVDRIDVMLSPETVQIAYDVSNAAANDQDLLVTFPLPEVDRYTFGDDHESWARRDPVNTVGAVANVDGQPVSMVAQQRAMALGLDVTSIVQGAGLPLLPGHADVEARIAALAPAVFADLRERGAVIFEDERYRAGWTLHSTAYWKQRFTRQRTTRIELSYVPIAGRAIARSEAVEWAERQFCLTPDVVEDLRRRAQTAEPATLTSVRYYHTEPVQLERPPVFRVRLELPAGVRRAASCAGPLKPISPRGLEMSVETNTGDADIAIVFID